MGCEHCKKKGELTKEWRQKTYLHINEWLHETITVCSKECATYMDRKRSTYGTISPKEWNGAEQCN
jgi:hypothetical protein